MNNKPTLSDKEEIEYFKSIVKGHTTNEIINLFDKKYNKILTIGQVKNQNRWFKLTSDIDCKFKKGNNIGNKTRFKKGQKAHNWKPVGYEFLRDDGYIEIKVAEPNTWKLKHNYIYEKYKGKIPKGYSVVFLDQDKTNFSLDNLMLVKIKDKLTAKNMKLFSSNKEITKTGLLVARLINKNSELKNEI